MPPDGDEIDDSIKDSFLPWIDEFPDTDPLSLINLAGDENQKNKIRLLAHEFQDVFSSELSHTPADIPPFDFNVNDSQWKVSKIDNLHGLNQKLIKLIFSVKLQSLKNKGLLQNQTRLIIAKFYWFQSLMELSACVLIFEI